MPDFTNIAFCARSESRLFLVALAREIKRRHGSRIHLYCSGPQEVAYYNNLNDDGVFTSVVDGGILFERAFDADLNEDDVMARARAFEELTGYTINRMVVSNRHFGRGYALGGFYHPRSRYSEKVDYVHMVHAYCSCLEFWDREFSDKSITLCINGSKEAAYVAHARKIPYRAIAGSRVKNLHYWSKNELSETDAFERSWRSGSQFPDITMDAPYYTHQVNRKRFLKNFSLRALAHNWALTTARYLYWRLRGYQKAKVYYYAENMRFFWHVWRDYRELRRLSGARLSDLEGKKFVYFPMHVEPETALQGISPEYFYQHALIAAVSRDLPAGYCLAVKEAYGAIGRRPANFYRQVADLKNVVFLDTWEVGFDCARKADAVVTICGTAGLEAAVAGRPVIAFGRHNIYNFLPSVRVVEDECDLPEYLREALGDGHDPEQTQADAKRLLQAIADNSFDMGAYDYVNLKQFEAQSVEAACDKLEASLGDEAKANRLAGAAAQ